MSNGSQIGHSVTIPQDTMKLSRSGGRWRRGESRIETGDEPLQGGQITTVVCRPGSAPSISAVVRQVMAMTQQYLVGEFSLLLAQQHSAATTPGIRDRIAVLRRQVELLPPTALSPALAGAMSLADASCWESLTQGDTAAFNRQAAVSAELYEFGVCSGLLGRSSALIGGLWGA